MTDFEDYNIKISATAFLILGLLIPSCSTTINTNLLFITICFEQTLEQTAQISLYIGFLWCK